MRASCVPAGQPAGGPPEPSGEPPDRLTLLYDAGGRPLTKGYERRGGRVVKIGYPKAAEFHARTVPLDGFASLGRALDRIAVEGRACVVRGRPGRFHPRDGTPAFRLLAPQPGLAYPNGQRVPAERIARDGLAADGERFLAVTWLPTFEDAPRRWLVLDIDRLPVPAGLDDWAVEPEAAVEQVLALLPEPFRDASCWWQVSASAVEPGADGPAKTSPTIRLKLAFWLDRPLAGREAKAWLAAERAPADPSVFNAVQPIYVAAPTFGGGLHDPVPRRTGIWRSLTETVAVPDVLPRPAYEQHGEAGGTIADNLDGLAEELRRQAAATGHVREPMGGLIRAYVRRHGRGVDRRALASTLTTVAHEFRSPAEVAGYGIARLVDYHAERAPERAPEPASHWPAVELDPAEASVRLHTVIERVLNAALAWHEGGGPAPQIGLEAAAGLGKSRAVLAALAGKPGLNAEFYVPTAKLAQELAEAAQRAGMRALVIRGREAVVGTAPLCEKHEEARTLGRAGLPVGPLLCRRTLDDGTEQRCPFFDTCRYQAQFRDDAPGLRILLHEHLFLPRPKGLPAPDIVVIDESFALKAARHASFGLDRLTAVRPAAIKPEHEAELHDTARKVRDLLEQGADPRTAGDPDTFRRCAELETSAELDGPIWPSMRWEEQRKRLAALQKREAGRLAAFWRVLAAEAERTGPVQRILLRRNEPGRDGELRDRVHVWWRAPWRVPDVPVLALDASLDAAIAAKLLPRLRVETIAARRNAEVIQVRDTACSRNRLLSFEGAPDEEKARAANRLRDVRHLAELCGSAGRTLLVTYKPAAEQLHGIPGVDVAHFGALRGLDAFKAHDTIIVAGREQPPPAEVESLARALFGDDETPLELPGTFTTATRGYRLRDGSSAGAEVAVHPDPRCRSILELIRERETEQAIDRLRLIHRDRPARVILLSNIPVDATVDRLVTWNEIVPDRLTFAAARLGGVLPLVPAWLAERSPELWSSVKAAEHEIERAVSNPQTPNKTFYLGNGGFIRAEFRLAGRRGGKPSRALIRPDVAEPEAALAALVGPLASFRMLDGRPEEPVPAAPTAEPETAAAAQVPEAQPAPCAWEILVERLRAEPAFILDIAAPSGLAPPELADPWDRARYGPPPRVSLLDLCLLWMAATGAEPLDARADLFDYGIGRDWVFGALEWAAARQGVAA